MQAIRYNPPPLDLARQAIWQACLRPAAVEHRIALSLAWGTERWSGAVAAAQRFIDGLPEGPGHRPGRRGIGAIGGR